MDNSKICPICGKEFYLSSKHPHAKFCSSACSAKSRKIRVITKCECCGKEFDRLPSQDTRFCSRKCSAIATQKRDSRKFKLFTCVVCGKLFEDYVYRNRTCCSMKCASRLGIAAMPRNIKRKPESYVKLTCEICGNEYETHITQAARGSRFCSRKCKSIARSISMMKNGNHNFRGGTIRYRGRNWSSQSRAALKRDGYRCQICHKDLYKHSWDYGVHHIKPYRDFNGDYESANRLENLITLCRKCHAKVEHGDTPCPKLLM